MPDGEGGLVQLTPAVVQREQLLLRPVRSLWGFVDAKPARTLRTIELLDGERMVVAHGTPAQIEASS